MKSSLLTKIVLTAVLLGIVSTSRAQIVTNNFNFTVEQIVPDNEPTGLASSTNITTAITNISDIQVTLNIDGGAGTGFNGDLYAYITHDSGFAILLNRPGRTATDDSGYLDNGFNITFRDDAVNGDIHVYQNVVNPAGGTLTGTWQPDGRNVLPTASLDTTPRTAMLSSFAGLNPNGNWTLFLVDNEAVGEFVLHSWGMQIMGAIPEPSTYALMGMGATGLLFLRRRKI